MAKISRRDFLKYSGLSAAGSSIAVKVVAAAPASGPAVRSGTAPWQITWSAADQSPDPAAILLSRASFGPKPGQLEQVRRSGIDQWIEQQLHPEMIADSTLERMLAGLPTLTMTIPQLVKQYPPKSKPGPRQVVFELQKAALLRAIYSERQLLEVMVDFWSNHFNIFIQKDQCKLLKTIDDREVIRKHALGRFQDLLAASVRSPAMLNYLDNRSNVKGVPNENYARELLELHTLGVDGGYTQEDVLEVARCLTGWTYRLRGADPGFVFDRTKHDVGAKTVLGVSFPANDGIQDGIKVIDILAKHPATAQLIATKLVRRFVSDRPLAELVDGVARVFTRSGGDIRQTMAALLHAPEFASSFGQKIKRPFEMHVAALRALDAITDGEQPLLAQLNLMGQAPFQWQPPDGYPDAAEAWINTSGLLNRWNYSLALLEGRIRGTRVDTRTPTVAADPRTAAALVDLWTERLLHRALPSADREQLISYISDGKPGQFRLTERILSVKVPELVALIMNSPHFQWR